MPSGITLKLREIQPQWRFIPSGIYKDTFCFKGYCIHGVSDRKTRRDIRFKRGQFKEAA